MKLHSPEFEKALRHGVRQVVRSSPELKREYRAARSGQGNPYINGIVKCWWVFFIGGLIAVAVNKRENIEFGLAIISLVGAVFMFSQSNQLLYRLFQAPELAAFVLLPVAEERIFKWVLWQFIRRSLPTMFFYAISFVTLAAQRDLSPRFGVLVPVFIGLNWAGMVALSIICAAYVPRKISAFGLLLSLLSVGVLLFVVLKEPLWAKFFDPFCWPLSIILPTGWPAVLYSSLIDGWNWKYCGFIGLLGGVFWGVHPALARLSSHYELVEISPVEAPDLVPGEVLPAVAGTRPENSYHLGETEIADLVESRQMFTVPVWRDRGWFEALLWRWLTPREQALGEYAFPLGLNITQAWWRIFRNLALACGVVMLGKVILTSMPISGIISGIILMVPSGQALSQIYGHGRAFSTVHSSGYNIPRHACLGIGYSELSWLLFKCGVAQVPLFLLFSLAVGSVVAVLFALPFGDCEGLAFKIGLACLLTRPFFMILAFSEVSRDSVFRLRWRECFYSGMILGGILLYLGLTIVMLVIPILSIALLCSLLALATAWFCWWLYGCFMQGNNFDLMKAPR